MVPKLMEPIPANYLALMRAHVASNGDFFEKAKVLAQAGWFEFDPSLTVECFATLAPRSMHFRMLLWFGILAVEDQDIDRASEVVEQILRIARVCLRTHHPDAIAPLPIPYQMAARLTERIASKCSPDVTQLQRLRNAWVISKADSDISPELHHAFSRLAVRWDSLLSADVFPNAPFTEDRFRMILAVAHQTGLHQRDAMAALGLVTNTTHWKLLLGAENFWPSPVNQPDGVLMRRLSGPVEDIEGIIDSKRLIFKQAIAVQVGLAIREEQLQNPTAPLAQLRQVVATLPALGDLATSLRHSAETNGFGVHFGYNRASYSSVDIRFELRRNDWVEPAP